MADHVIPKGLDLPIGGKPEQTISDASNVTQVALLGHDYPTMKPRMHCKEGDKVALGQLLFEDRKSEGVLFTAPAAGTVKAIHRGDKRVFQSLVIEVDDDEKQVDFDGYAALSGRQAQDYRTDADATPSHSLDALTGEQARALLSESGLWTSLRMRPFSRIPSTKDSCKHIFVTAIDTNPLAPSIETIVEGRQGDMAAGLQVLSTLTEGSLFLCVGADWKMDVLKGDGAEHLSKEAKARIKVERFSGPHPAGLVGTHIHLLAPVNRDNPVWHIGVQDLMAIGQLFRTGKLDTGRVLSLAGPVVTSPRLLRTRLGASIDELIKGETKDGLDVRVVSGSVLFGHEASEEAFGFVNRYDQQISCLEEDRERVMLGWLKPGLDKFSTVRSIFGAWLGSKQRFTTSTHGSHRAMVPIGMFERVMPLDIMPTFLLRAIVVGDIERAEQLGCLELHEEDLALCTFVSPGKTDFGKALRNLLTTIWTEG